TGTKHGDVVKVTVTPTDPDWHGSVTSASDQTTLANSAPTATVSPSPVTPKSTDTVTATTSKADADGDPVTLTYVWKVNGTVVSGATGSTLSLSTVAGIHKGQSVSVSVTPNDGTVDGTAATSSVTVANTPAAPVSVTIAPTSPKTKDVLTATATATDA